MIEILLKTAFQDFVPTVVADLSLRNYIIVKSATVNLRMDFETTADAQPRLPLNIA